MLKSWGFLLDGRKLIARLLNSLIMAGIWIVVEINKEVRAILTIIKVVKLGYSNGLIVMTLPLKNQTHLDASQNKANTKKRNKSNKKRNNNALKYKNPSVNIHSNSIKSTF